MDTGKAEKKKDARKNRKNVETNSSAERNSLGKNSLNQIDPKKKLQ